jgi:hypothetical protein
MLFPQMMPRGRTEPSLREATTPIARPAAQPSVAPPKNRRLFRHRRAGVAKLSTTVKLRLGGTVDDLAGLARLTGMQQSSYNPNAISNNELRHCVAF